MKKTNFLSVTLVALLLTALCACSDNKKTTVADPAANDPAQSALAQDSIRVADSIRADSAAKAAAAAEAEKLDPEAMKAVVRKLFNKGGFASNADVLALMSSRWRAKYEKRCRNTDVTLLSSGGDQSLDSESLKITSVNPESGIVKASAILSSPDPDSESGIWEDKTNYMFKIVKEGDKHLIDHCEFGDGFSNGGMDW